MSTPEHIKPEWYFLFAYALLRAVPNKMGGVIALVVAVAMLRLMAVGAPPLSGVSKRGAEKVV